MNQLVIIQNRQAVTTSLQVAESFDKQHKHVLEAIDELRGVAENSADLFYEDSYTHPQNKQRYRMYYMNRDGFTLLAMGFTGTKAIQFKLDYIKAFNQMEQHIKAELPSDPIELALKTSLENYKEIKSLQGDVSLLKNSMRIDGAQEFALQSQGKAKVLEVLGGYDSAAYKELGRKAFQQLWRDFKNYFKLPRYSDLPKSKFDDAVKFIGIWQPDTAMRMEIETANN